VTLHEIQHEAIEHIRTVFAFLARQLFAVLNQFSHTAVAPTLPLQPPQTVFVETKVIDQFAVLAELPFTRDRRPVTSIPQVVAKRALRRRQFTKMGVVSHVVLARHDLHASRRAQGLRMSLRKRQTRRGPGVKARRHVVRRTITRQILVADIVSPHEHDVGLGCHRTQYPAPRERTNSSN
jgi:hypothetical protein